MRSCWVVIGMITWSSWLLKPDPPDDCRTPTTVNGVEARVTIDPVDAPNVDAVVEPSTATSACLVTLPAVKKLPLASVLLLAASQASLLPTTVVVVLREPLTTVAELWFAGATALISGASNLFDSPLTSFIVSVATDPWPPRTPPERLLPPLIVSSLVPSEAIRLFTVSLDAWPIPTVEMTAATPKRMPRVVRTDRKRCAP